LAIMAKNVTFFWLSWLKTLLSFGYHG